MPEEDMNQRLRLKKLDEIRNYLVEEINRNELMSKKHKKVCRVLNYIDHSLIAISAITGRLSISFSAFLVGIPITVRGFAIGLNICVITTWIKYCKPIIKKNKKHDKIRLLAKSQLHRIEVLISKAIVDSNISHDEFVLINNVLKEFNDMKEQIKDSNNK